MQISIPYTCNRVFTLKEDVPFTTAQLKDAMRNKDYSFFDAHIEEEDLEATMDSMRVGAVNAFSPGIDLIPEKGDKPQALIYGHLYVVIVQIHGPLGELTEEPYIVRADYEGTAEEVALKRAKDQYADAYLYEVLRVMEVTEESVIY